MAKATMRQNNLNQRGQSDYPEQNEKETVTKLTDRKTKRRTKKKEEKKRKKKKKRKRVKKKKKHDFKVTETENLGAEARGSLRSWDRPKVSSIMRRARSMASGLESVCRPHPTHPTPPKKNLIKYEHALKL